MRLFDGVSCTRWRLIGDSASFSLDQSLPAYTAAMAANRDFADYCCELVSSVGPCLAKRMFGGWGLSLEGLTFAIIADLGDGEKLWLKADAQTLAQFEAQGGKRFSMTMQKKNGPKRVSMGYYSAPVDAMESSLAMAPWARLALGTALRARSPETKRTNRP